MPGTSSASIRAAVPVRHESNDSQRVDRAKALRMRHGFLNNSGPAIPVDRESTGRIVTLGPARFGALAPRDPKGWRRRQLGAASSTEEAQRLIDNWRAGRKTIVAFVVWLSAMGGWR